MQEMDTHAAILAGARTSERKLPLPHESQALAKETSFEPQWTEHRSCGATWGVLDTPAISSSEVGRFQMISSTAPGSSLPTTPNRMYACLQTRGCHIHPHWRHDQHKYPSPGPSYWSSLRLIRHSQQWCHCYLFNRFIDRHTHQFN